MDKTAIASSVGSGIVGVFLGYLGFRSKVARLETSVVYIAKELKEIKKSQAETQRVMTSFHEAISTLLERTKDL